MKLHGKMNSTVLAPGKMEKESVNVHFFWKLTPFYPNYIYFFSYLLPDIHLEIILSDLKTLIDVQKILFNYAKVNTK